MTHDHVLNEPLDHPIALSVLKVYDAGCEFGVHPQRPFARDRMYANDWVHGFDGVTPDKAPGGLGVRDHVRGGVSDVERVDHGLKAG